MQKKWIIALCALIVVAATWTGLAGVTGVNYAGFISNAYPVHMDLVINGTKVTGSYYYDRQGILITLKGKLENRGTLRMLEYDPQGKCTGWFEGELGAGGIRGIWSTPDGTTMMPFYLEEAEDVPPSQESWTGRWSRDGNDLFNFAYVEIKEVPNGINFDLKAGYGANSGWVEGTAGWQSKTVAFWTSNEDDAQVRFVREGDKLLVETENVLGGIGVSYDGIFHRGLPRERQETLVQRWALETPVQESAFIKLVGREDYYRFLYSFQIPEGQEDLDGFGARVVSGGVRGGFGYSEAIIMADPQGRIWAAVLEDDGIEYFTNDPAYAKKLPQTIAKWREERFPESQVIFMNAPK